MPNQSKIIKNLIFLTVSESKFTNLIYYKELSFFSTKLKTKLFRINKCKNLKIVSKNIWAQISFGKPKIPLEIAGKEIDL